MTTVPTRNLSRHLGPQLMPAGDDVTVPVPLPVFLTLRPYLRLLRVKVALTVFAASMVTRQAPVPEHAPPQPVKIDPGELVAVRLTIVPAV